MRLAYERLRGLRDFQNFSFIHLYFDIFDENVYIPSSKTLKMCLLHYMFDNDN